MFSTEQLKIVINFLLDASKIIFGSLVVGVFLPNNSGKISWLTFISGIIITLMFLGYSMRLSDKNKI